MYYISLFFKQTLEDLGFMLKLQKQFNELVKINFDLIQFDA